MDTWYRGIILSFVPSAPVASNSRSVVYVYVYIYIHIYIYIYIYK